MKAVTVSPITNHDELAAALSRVEALMDLDLVEGSVEDSELSVLSVLIESYETSHFPMPPPDPISTLEFYLEQLALGPQDLEPCIGSRTRVWEVLNRRRPLTLRMIRRLSALLGIPAGFLTQEYPLAA